jgi:hypothetical protein
MTPHFSCPGISSFLHDTVSSSSTPMMSDIALHALTTVFTPSAWCSTLWVNYGDFGAGNGFGAKQGILALPSSPVANGSSGLHVGVGCTLS